MTKMPELFDVVHADCIFDICSTGEIKALCDAGLNLAIQCMAAGINVDGWRAIHEECCEWFVTTSKITKNRGIGI